MRRRPRRAANRSPELVDANDRGLHDDDVTELTVEGD
jgi:hypothetical protein